MGRESWQAALNRQVEEARERAKERPRPWWVYADGLFRDLFAEGDDRYVMDRTLFAMRVAAPCRRARECVPASFRPKRGAE